MNKKKNILMLLESQVDKIVLGVIVVISLAFLWMYVVGNPYGAKVKIGMGREVSVGPGNIDKKIRDEADRLLDGLDEPAEATEYVIYDKTDLSDYEAKLQCAFAEIPTDISIPHPGEGEAVIEEDRLYAIPVIPVLTDVRSGVLRGAAQVPVEEVTPGNPYDSVETEVQDLDFVTLSGRFDFQSLYNNFQLSYAGPRLKSSWKDPRLAKPVFARIELQRRTKQPDGSWSDWKNVPRAKIDEYKELLEDLPLSIEQMQFGVDIWMSQYADQDVQLDLLQPDSYHFDVSRVEWMPPEYLDETCQILDERAEKLRREEIEERKKAREAEKKKNRPTANRRGGGGGMPGFGGGGGRQPRTPRKRDDRERERQAATAARRAKKERTLQDVESDVKKDTLDEKTRLESLREPGLVWGHDDTIQPGMTYEYRMRVGVFNPIAGKDWFRKEEAEFKNQTVLWSGYSEPTEEIEIPKMIHVFPMEILATKDNSKQVEGVKVEIDKYFMGKWHTHEFEVYPGQTIGQMVEDGEDDEENQNAFGGETALNLQNLEKTEVDYTSGMTMVDVAEEVAWLRLKRKNYYTMIYSNVDGLAQEAVGNANWSDALKKAYKEVQVAMDQEVQERTMDRTTPTPGMMPPGMLPPGFGGPGMLQPGFGPGNQ